MSKCKCTGGGSRGGIGLVWGHEFLARLDKSRKSSCTTPGFGVGGGVSISKMLKFLG